MLYRLALLLLFLWYIRPQDWVSGLIGVNIVRPLMAIWLVLWFVSDTRLRTPLKGFLKTPHDWAMLAYYGYVVWTAPSGSGALTGFLPSVVFYALTVQSLSSWRQVLGYLKWWNWMLLCLAIFGVLQVYGLDLTGGQAYTDAAKGRLCLGTWICNNPNAVGHYVVIVLPLSYMAFFWKRNLFCRTVIFPICVLLAGTCAWHTQSKGAFVVGGLLLVMVFVIGRPKLVQISAIAAAAILGVSALSFLPRMGQMENLRDDEGVQGRLLAWEHARTVVRNEPTGVGWRQFVAEVPWREGKRVVYFFIATHSSYVKIGADLGVYGLFIYVGVIWTALHTLLAFKTQDIDQERGRRMALVLIVAYLASGWMINREYHTEYFLMISVAAAIHRLRLAEENTPEEQHDSIFTEKARLGGQEQASRSSLTPEHLFNVATDPASSSAPDHEAQGSDVKQFWNRFGLLDVAVSIAGTFAVLRIWDYIMENL
jgi:hypothetical protein